MGSLKRPGEKLSSSENKGSTISLTGIKPSVTKKVATGTGNYISV